MEPNTTIRPEAERVAALLDAQRKAEQLFAEIGDTLVRPGLSESQLTRAIGELARERFGVERHWHKRVVRAGPNTLEGFDAEPPEHVLGEDDILFVDLGPVFEEWEADFGRSFVLGNDPFKRRLCTDAAAAFAETKVWFDSRDDITGAELFAHVRALAHQAGWEFGGRIAGHLIGEFPHKAAQGEWSVAYATPEHTTPMRGLDRFGRENHWILEIHFVDRARRIGAFYEELLTIG